MLSSDILRRQVIFTSSSSLGNAREIRSEIHFCAIHSLWERKSAMVL